MKKTVLLRAAAGLLAAAMLLTGCREKRRTPDAEAEGKILTVCISRDVYKRQALQDRGNMPVDPGQIHGAAREHDQYHGLAAVTGGLQYLSLIHI